MNIYKLNEGLVFNNYKHLCEELGVIAKNGGKSKIYQLRDFERYFSFHKEGFKIVIDAVYENPIPKQNNKKKYKDSLSNLILHAIKIRKGVEDMYFTPIALLQYIRVYERDSNLCDKASFRDSRQVAKELGISQQTVEDFYYYISAKSREIIQSSLRVVNQVEQVHIDKCIMLSIGKCSCEATKEQSEVLKRVEKNLIQKKHLKNYYQLYRSHTAKTFNPMVLRKFEEDMRIPNVQFDYYYRAYKIQVTGDKKQLPSSQIKGKVEEVKDELSRVICNHTRKLYMKRQDSNGVPTDFRGTLRYRQEIYTLTRALLQKSNSVY